MIALRPRHLLLAALLLSAACDSQPAKPPGAQRSAAAEKEVASLKTRRQVTGVVTAVEEGAYPDFSITIQPVSGGAVSLGRGARMDMMPEAARELKGQRVTAAYDVYDAPMVMDITQAGKSLQGRNAPKHQPDWKQVTGKLGGDNSASGDEPGEITITPAGGTAWKFDYFVTEAELKARGQEVTAWYYIRKTEDLVSITEADTAGGGLTPEQRKAAAQKYTAAVKPRGWKDDELHEVALVRKVTATGGTNYVIAFEFRAGQPLFEFTVNVARLGLTGSPEVLTGEEVFLYYDTDNRVTYLKVPLN